MVNLHQILTQILQDRLAFCIHSAVIANYLLIVKYFYHSRPTSSPLAMTTHYHRSLVSGYLLYQTNVDLYDGKGFLALTELPWNVVPCCFFVSFLHCVVSLIFLPLGICYGRLNQIHCLLDFLEKSTLMAECSYLETSTDIAKRCQDVQNAKSLIKEVRSHSDGFDGGLKHYLNVYS